MGADTVSMQGKWLGVFEKQLDGTWQMAVECWNLDAPLPPTEAP
jgi:ketosteroid isomerase-like protein